MSLPGQITPKVARGAIKVVLLQPITTEDGDLVPQGTSGTLLRWADNAKGSRATRNDTVVVAWDAYLFVGTDQCCSRHCSKEGGLETEVDVAHIRYIGPTDYTMDPSWGEARV